MSVSSSCPQCYKDGIIQENTHSTDTDVKCSFSQYGTVKQMVNRFFNTYLGMASPQISYFGSLGVHSSDKSRTKIFWTPILAWPPR